MANSAAFATDLQGKGYELVSGGTDNHLVLVDLKKSKVRRAQRTHDLPACAACAACDLPAHASACLPAPASTGQRPACLARRTQAPPCA